MQVKTLSNGFAMPVLGMGTWQFGGRQDRNPDNDDAGQIASLQAGIEAGFNLIDTAEYYAAGYAETLVGKAIAGYPREKLFLGVARPSDAFRRAARQTIRRKRRPFRRLKGP